MKKRIILLLISILAAAIVLPACITAPSDDDPFMLSQQYYYSPSDGLSPSWMMFSENNEFQLVFSVASSYIGDGTYRIDGDELILNTSDGKYHYAFMISGDDLVFDAENSSEQLWFASFTDGSVFEPFAEN